MRCLTCQSISFLIICKSCQEKFLTPKIKKRFLAKDFFVYSFYAFSEIESLLNSKYQKYGDEVYKILAKNSFKPFSQTYLETYKNEKYFTALGIDDYPMHGFSQSAILAKSLQNKYFKAKYGLLRAKTRVKYAGKSLEFRKANPRNFICKVNNIKNKSNIVLVDDIVTSGTTLLEAKQSLEKNSCKISFALSLADVRR